MILSHEYNFHITLSTNYPLYFWCSKSQKSAPKRDDDPNPRTSNLRHIWGLGEPLEDFGNVSKQVHSPHAECISWWWLYQNERSWNRSPVCKCLYTVKLSILYSTHWLYILHLICYDVIWYKTHPIYDLEWCHSSYQAIPYHLFLRWNRSLSEAVSIGNPALIYL